MHQHAVRTAMALYTGGTLDLETAARQAGGSTDRIERAARRLGRTRTTASSTSDRLSVAADWRPRPVPGGHDCPGPGTLPPRARQPTAPSPP